MKRFLLTLAISLAIVNPIENISTRAKGEHKAFAAFDVFTGSFTGLNGTGSQAITGVGFQPKVVILYFAIQPVNTLTDYYVISFGWTDCTDEGVRAGRIEDNSFLHNSGFSQSNADIFRFLDIPGGGLLAEASFTSCDADGFTINWDVNSVPVQWTPHIIAFGGTGLTAKVGTFSQPVATGSQATTGVGFEPQLVWFLPGIEGQTTTNGTGNSMEFMLGAMNATGQWSTSSAANDNASVSLSTQRTDRVIHQVDVDADSTVSSASRTSLDADGWTLNWSTVDTAEAEPVWYLAMRGISSFISSVNQPTSNGTQALTSFGFTPTALLLASWNLVTSSSTQNGAGAGVVSIGFAAGADQTGIWDSAEYAVPTIPARAGFNTDMFRMYTANATGSSSTLNAAADLQSFDAAGATLNWTTTDATAREILILGLGAASTVTPFMQNPILICCR